METLLKELNAVLNQLNAASHLDQHSVPTSLATLTEELLLLEKLDQSLLQGLGYLAARRTRLLLGLTRTRTTIHCLPPELLVDIFTYAVIVDRGIQRWYLNPDLGWGPAQISHVCQKWRVLALGTSILWSTVFPQTGSALNTHLRYAGHQDIDVVWRGAEKASGPVYGRLLRLACGELCDRVRSITWVDRSINLYLLFAHGPFSHLRELTLAWGTGVPLGSPARVTMPMLSAFLRQVPGLRELSLDGYLPIMDTSDQATAIDTPSLRTFTWNDAPSPYFWQLLSILHMPSLSSLHLSTKLYRHNAETPRILAPPRLSTVQHLSLSCEDANAFKVACRYLELPNLETLVLDRSNEHEYPELPGPQLVFREPRMAKLTSLELNNLDLSLEEVVEFLRYSPSLKRFALNTCKGVGLVICSLSRNTCCGHVSANSWLCPFLEELTVKNSPCIKFRCLAAAVRERQAHSQPSLETNPSTRDTKPAKMTTSQLSACPARPTVPMTPTKLNRILAQSYSVSSPNGSLLNGWRAHEAVRPSRIRVIRIQDCKRISQIELLSLQEAWYGVDRVFWS